jgi:hypothetical protein
MTARGQCSQDKEQQCQAEARREFNKAEEELGGSAWNRGVGDKGTGGEATVRTWAFSLSQEAIGGF